MFVRSGVEGVGRRDSGRRCYVSRRSFLVVSFGDASGSVSRPDQDQGATQQLATLGVLYMHSSMSTVNAAVLLSPTGSHDSYLLITYRSIAAAYRSSLTRMAAC